MRARSRLHTIAVLGFSAAARDTLLHQMHRITRHATPRSSQTERLTCCSYVAARWSACFFSRMDLHGQRLLQCLLISRLVNATDLPYRSSTSGYSWWWIFVRVSSPSIRVRKSQGNGCRSPLVFNPHAM
jgi:hypothetical protein